jgi:flavin reductase (DIM6/NTAB) family NADH-FMN oxidoreductase RutF
MHISSYEFPEDVSEFDKAGLHTAPAAMVQHPRIAEAAASLECRVERILEISATRELVLGEILLVHARDGIIDPQTKRISEQAYRPIGRLFADRYCTTRQRFNLPGDLPS